MNGLALCAGIGGLELGIKRAYPQYKTVCYVEQNCFAAAVIVARMEEKALDQAPIWDDLATFNCQRWRGKVDIITAGFPCQPVSIAGKRKFTDDKRWQWDQIERISLELRPSLLFLENVSGIISMGLETILRSLAEMGYHARWCCIPASAVAAPHVRERFFCLAYSNGARFPRQEWEGNNVTKCTRWNPEPEICRVDDGTPFRMDRLYCLGNAVVPAQAELAWRILTNET